MIASLVLAQIVLPLAAIAWLAIAPPPSLIGISVQALATAIGLFALSRIGVWLFPPWWTPYVYNLSVRKGMKVNIGDCLAEVGNSGVSDEPHLHIHAQRPGSSAAPISGEPLPMNFDGRFPIRNDRVSMPMNNIGKG